jgi:hypothetical protein
MKNRIVVVGLLITLASVMGRAQDTTRRSVRGFRLGAELGLLPNNSLTSIGQTLQQTSIDAGDVGNTFSNFVLSFVRDNRKYMAETRFVGMGPTNNGPTVSPAVRRARLYGFGVGFSGTYKVVNTRRFIVGPMLGYDVMWYRLSLLPVDRDNLLLANVANNPAAYNPVTFRQGLYLNLHVAAAVDYRVYWFKRYYDEFRFGARVGYQLPFLRDGPWRFNDGTIGDLPGFQAKTLYFQFGFTFFPKKPSAIR